MNNNNKNKVKTTALGSIWSNYSVQNFSWSPCCFPSKQFFFKEIKNKKAVMPLLFFLEVPGVSMLSWESPIPVPRRVLGRSRPPLPENYSGLPPGVSTGLRIFSASRPSSLSIDKVEGDLWSASLWLRRETAILACLSSRFVFLISLYLKVYQLLYCQSEAYLRPLFFFLPLPRVPLLFCS